MMWTIVSNNNTVPVMQWEECQRPIAAKCGFEHNQVRIKTSIIAISTNAFTRDVRVLFIRSDQIKYRTRTSINTLPATCASIRIPDNNMFMP